VAGIDWDREDARMTANAPAAVPPPPGGDEREALLGFLDWKRGAVLKTAEGLTDEQARWTPEGKLLPIAGIIHHLTCVEGRWIDGRYLREEPPERTDREFEVKAPLADLIDAYVVRAAKTNEIVKSAPSLDVECLGHQSQPPRPGLDLRWVVIHLLEETAQHAGHADSTREMLDGARSTD
jgi:hypothetical protein